VREKKGNQEEKDPFEEMMSRFKSRSEEKISDLKKNVDHHRCGGGGYSKKGNRKF
jgi:predicted RNA-binding protein with RPS1 domain